MSIETATPCTQKQRAALLRVCPDGFKRGLEQLLSDGAGYAACLDAVRRYTKNSSSVAACPDDVLARSLAGGE